MRMESPAAEASSKALAAAGDNLGLLVRYQTIACVSATTAGIRSHPWGNSSNFPAGPRRSPRRSDRYSDLPIGRARSGGASAAASPRREGAVRDPGVPAACLQEAPGPHRESLVPKSSESPPASIIGCFWRSEKGMVGHRRSRSAVVVDGRIIVGGSAGVEGRKIFLSKYIECQTVIGDRKFLVAALAELGYHVEVHPEG